MKKTIAVMVLAVGLAGQVASAGEPPTNVYSIVSNALSVVIGYTNGIFLSTNDWSIYASSIVEIRLAEGGRMTRPVETVSVVTNVTTEVIETKTLRFKWNDEECVVERKRVLSKNVRRWVRKDNWSEE